MSVPQHAEDEPRGVIPAITRFFLESNLSVALILLGVTVGAAALFVTPREEDPQIVVPLADVHVQFPGRSAEEVEQQVATPLEKLLYEIDGVEYVYSTSRDDGAVITVRFFVGEDRERSLVKIYKRIDEHVDEVPPGVTGWVVKPVEIDDVPIVTLTLRSASADGYTLRRVGEEMVRRLARVENLSRAYVVGGYARMLYVYLDTEAMAAHQVSPLSIARAIRGANVSVTVGDFARLDEVWQVKAGPPFASKADLEELVVAVHGDHPVHLKDVARIVDGPEEVTNYVRHGWGPARGFEHRADMTGTLVGSPAPGPQPDESVSAVTVAVAKKRGTNAVNVAHEILTHAAELKRTVVPDDVEMVITRNAGLTADDKVNELVQSLGVAVFIVIALLTLGLGGREALIVAVTVPVVFGLTLAVNLLFGYTINRVTLFALILSLGLLVDDPTADVENISRHFALRRRASRSIVLTAVAELRPPLIMATLAVIVSFLPMFFITGMMGPYMRPMALNVPVTMLMSVVVSFTITPWLAYQVLHRRYANQPAAAQPDEADDMAAIRNSLQYRLFYPLMAPLLSSRKAALTFLGVMMVTTVLAVSLAATRNVPLKMLPYDNKNELLLVLDWPEGTTLERSDAGVRAFERYLDSVPEVTDYTSYVGLASPMDFNGMVRHYYLRSGPNVAEIRVGLVGKNSRRFQSHAVGLQMRDALTALADTQRAALEIVETPPGPPVLAPVVAEIYGQPDHSYEDLIEAAGVVRARMEIEPGLVDFDDSVELSQGEYVFVADRTKAALNGVAVAEIAETLRAALAGTSAGTLHAPHERNPLAIELRLPRAGRAHPDELSRIRLPGTGGTMVPLAELGDWEQTTVGQSIQHKNLRRVVYVYAGTAGRPPADAVVDIQADRVGPDASPPEMMRMQSAGGWVSAGDPRAVGERSFLRTGGGVPWHVREGIEVTFAGEGEWKITLDVFRDLGLAFAAALGGIYLLLTGQMRSFVLPLVVMLAIPLTVLGIMPGFALLNTFFAGREGGYADPIYFTATGMIGMIALAGIATRDAIVLVDFIRLSLRRGRSLFDAIMESRVVRLRPILLTTGTTMLSAAPITLDPIFSGLAWALIFGLFASTLFTLFVIPVAYWLLYSGTASHGPAAHSTEQ